MVRTNLLFLSPDRCQNKTTHELVNSFSLSVLNTDLSQKVTEIVSRTFSQAICCGLRFSLTSTRAETRRGIKHPSPLGRGRIEAHWVEFNLTCHVVRFPEVCYKLHRCSLMAFRASALQHGFYKTSLVETAVEGAEELQQNNLRAAPGPEKRAYQRHASSKERENMFPKPRLGYSYNLAASLRYRLVRQGPYVAPFSRIHIRERVSSPLRIGDLG